MLTLKKSLGQHFLKDEKICQDIVNSIHRSPGMNLVEIGPGGGAITKYLVKWEEVNFKAIELDDEKVVYLKKQYPVLKDKIIHIDFLKAEKPFDEKFSVIGNFPYNISSQILFRILDWKEDVVDVVGMFQKEVAERVASKEGSKVYGILSVLCQAYFEVNYLFDVHQNAFTPPPKVMSGVISLKNLNNPHEIINHRKFANVVKMSFSQRRKTLRNALKSMLAPEFWADEIFSKRAEQLSVTEFVNLYKTYFKDEI